MKQKLLRAALFLLCILFIMNLHMRGKYRDLTSPITYDRYGEIISVGYNTKGYQALPINEVPERLKELLLKKEDRFFYLHPGFNPFSMLRPVHQTLQGKPVGGSSTLTQQLTKNLLGNETNRSIPNKIIETAYAFALELFTTKETVLKMYMGTVFLGNSSQGFESAARNYFDTQASDLSENEILSLLATLSSPTYSNPREPSNRTKRVQLARHLTDSKAETVDLPRLKLSNIDLNSSQFELGDLNIKCTESCSLTIDYKLTKEIREMLARGVERAWNRGARNGAVVVIKIDESGNELLSIVGSPDPAISSYGWQINMALRPRPVGSTFKPFIYMKGIEAGLRPYSNIDDREYKYPIASGFPLYPKNYDGQYRGVVTLHESLSNSLNVPSVKILEYVGLETFYDFLLSDLMFIPNAPIESYQFGIALGALDIDLLTLTSLYTLFPSEGVLNTVYAKLDKSEPAEIPQMSNSYSEVINTKYAQITNKLLSDRLRGVDQFGLKSNLNVPGLNYGVKTGTSHDAHDTWTVGYSPDFVVGVWLGDAKNRPLAPATTGSSGAGSIWNEVMTYLSASSYNSGREFSFDQVESIVINDELEYGLIGDNYQDHINLMLDNKLILSPHDKDNVLFEETTSVILEANASVDWYVNNLFIGNGKKHTFKPEKTGIYTIKAIDKENNLTEQITIFVEER